MKKLSGDSFGKFVVAAASCVIYFLTFGTSRLSGQLYPACRERFNVGRKEASLPFVTCFTVRNIFGPIVGYFGNKFGLRCVTLAGCLLAAISLFACFFVEDIVSFTVLWGAGYGAGFGIATILIPNVLHLYFKKSFNRINGISLAVGCFGNFVLPGITETLLNGYGFSGTFLILSALVLHCVPAAMLLKCPDTTQEVKSHPEVNKTVDDTSKIFKEIKPESFENTSNLKSYLSELTSRKITSNNNSNTNTHGTKNWERVTYVNSSQENNETYIPNRYPQENQSHIPRNISKEPAVKELNNGITIKYNVTPKNLLNQSNDIHCEHEQRMIQMQEDFSEKDRHTTKRLDAIDGKVKNNSVMNATRLFYSLSHDFQVFLDPVYVLILLSLSIDLVVMTTQYTVIVDACRDKGITEDVTVMMTFAITDMLGRFLFGFVADGGCINQLNVFILCFGSLGLLLIGFTWLEEFYVVLLFVVGFGTLMGGLVVLPLGIIKKYIEKEKLVMAFSSRYILFGILNFLQPPVIGYFRETLHSYDGLFHLLGFMCLLGTFIAMFIPSAARSRDARNRDKNMAIAKENLVCNNMQK